MHTHIMLNGPKAFYTGQGDYDAFAIGAWAYRDMNILMDQGSIVSGLSKAINSCLFPMPSQTKTGKTIQM